MFDRTFVIHHGLALAMIAAGIIALVMRDVGWLIFSAWTILTVALYLAGWVYHLLVMRDRIPWDIDLDL